MQAPNPSPEPHYSTSPMSEVAGFYGTCIYSLELRIRKCHGVNGCTTWCYFEVRTLCHGLNMLNSLIPGHGSSPHFLIRSAAVVLTTMQVFCMKHTWYLGCSCCVHMFLRQCVPGQPGTLFTWFEERVKTAGIIVTGMIVVTHSFT